MKLPELRLFLQKKGIDALVLWGRDGAVEHAIEYLADAYPASSVRLIVPSRGPPTLYVPTLELSRMGAQTKMRVRRLEPTIPLHAKMIGYNGSYLSVNELAAMRAQLPRARFIDVSSELIRLRERKTREEIARIRRACAIGDSILGSLRRKIRSMRTEFDAARFLLDEMARRGVEPSFPPIVAAGANAASPHHEPGKGRLKGWLILDIGVRYRGYCSDMTRTWFVGKPKQSDIALYGKVLALQEKGVSECEAGMPAMEIDRRIRLGLGAQARYFIHGTGHSVGRQIHDPGIGIRASEKRLLREGNVVTVEPGLYWQGRGGIRIEDTVLVTKKDGVPLTRFPKQLITIT